MFSQVQKYCSKELIFLNLTLYIITFFYFSSIIITDNVVDIDCFNHFETTKIVFEGKRTLMKNQKYIWSFHAYTYTNSTYMQTEIEMDTSLFLKTLFILYLCYMFEVYPCCSLLYALADVHDSQHIYIF